MKRLHLGKDHYLTFFFIFLALLVVSLFGCLLFLQHINKLQAKSDHDRYESYLLADELRQSSDDLTKMIRMYVVTGDLQYKEYFYEILDIRSGKSPIPHNYHQIYWDLVEAGKPRPRVFMDKRALKERMLDHGFTVKEFDFLQKAENESNDLADLEIEAMHAMEGRFDDGTGSYPIRRKPDEKWAINLVFGKSYIDKKREIMLPLQEFFESVEMRTKQESERLHGWTEIIITISIMLAALSIAVMIISIYKALRSISKATSDNETLLLNVLPSPIADRLKQGEEPIADEIPQASVLFADIVGFTKSTTEFGASKMVQILNQLFAVFDTLSEEFGVEKVKTIGDSYMAVSGVPVQIPDHAIRLAKFALEILKRMEEFNKTHHVNFNLRIGMTYGRVIAGVIGHKKFIYDVWGDVVNTASRMESTGVSGKIQITDKMAMMLSEQFKIEERAEVDVKGLGKMKTFFLIGPK